MYCIQRNIAIMNFNIVVFPYHEVRSLMGDHKQVIIMVMNPKSKGPGFNSYCRLCVRRVWQISHFIVPLSIKL